jgi:hypothetical protein
VSQSRYGLSEDSSVSLVGGRIVGVEISIVIPWGKCCNLDAELSTALVK